MELVIIILQLALVIGLLAAGGFVVLLLRGSTRFGGRASINIDSIKTELDARYQADIERLRAEARSAVGEIEGELGRLREGLRTSTHEHDTQLARIRDRYAEVDGQTEQAVERVLVELRSHQEIELSRLREAVGAAMGAIAVRQQGGPESTAVAGRRADAVSGLYRRLAKLETCFASVTNPVLLPGEPFLLPKELVPETLKWENWKEVGDATFAFAEAFNHDRIYLDDATCRDLTAFVSHLRQAMTAEIYPNVNSPLGADRAESHVALHGVLEQLGREIAEARERLERSFRDSE